MNTLTPDDPPTPIADALAALRAQQQETATQVEAMLRRLRADEKAELKKQQRAALRSQERADVKRADKLAATRARRRQTSLSMAEYLKDKGYDV